MDIAWIKLRAASERLICSCLPGPYHPFIPLNLFKKRKIVRVEDKPDLLRVLAGERLEKPPIWIMRQAGRYLPEYRQIRAQAKSFLDFCYTPDLATEATLQPMRRFDLDAAILFSDILVVPDALGRKVWFVEGEGPRLEPLANEANWTWSDPGQAAQLLRPVYETVERVRAALAPDKALIGFAGGPWTVATYMIQGQGGDKAPSRLVAFQRAADVQRLLEAIVEATAQHMAAQVEAGVQALQIFESWAGGLPPALFNWLIVQPNAALVRRVRALGVTVPIIGFPREAGSQIQAYAKTVEVQGIGLDTAADPRWVRAAVGPYVALQGNLDPLALRVGGDVLKAGVNEALGTFEGPHIFNLGHGITPDVPPEHVEALIRLVKG